MLGVHRVAEDVAFQGGRGLLEPEKQGVTGAQADLGRNGQGEPPSLFPAAPGLTPLLQPSRGRSSSGNRPLTLSL